MDLGNLSVAEISIAVQFVVVGNLLVFFLLLRKAVRLEEVRLWSMAWLADLIALASILAIVIVPSGVIPLKILMFIYAGAKTAFSVLMVSGARNHVRPGSQPQIRLIPMVFLIAIWSLVVASLADRVAITQFAQTLMVGIIHSLGAWVVLRHPRSPVSRWLGLAFLIQAVLFLSYAVMLAPELWHGRIMVHHMSYSSFLDAWIELVLALSCLAAVVDRNQEQLRYANRELLDSQNQLRRLVDTDPLTGLANRRALRPIMGRAAETGSSVAFIDINNFKDVNDRFGHSVGDATLARMARVLTEIFRPQDSVVRYGGDEFLVIAPGMERSSVLERMKELRARLSLAGNETPGVEFAVGITEMEAGGDPSAALVRADHLMYRNKTGGL